MGLKIGELAKLASCRVVTIRYYEKKGLMPEPVRTSSNYRAYGPEALERLNFIRHCRSHGMTLEEIKGLINLNESSGVQCADVHRMLKKHISSIEEQIENLQRLKLSLQAILNECHGTDRPCEALRNLSAPEACVFCKYNAMPACGKK